MVLNPKQETFRSSRLQKAQFSISGFTDFRTPEKQWSSIQGVVNDETQPLRTTADRLGTGAQITLSPVKDNITMDTGDGWRITLTKDEHSEDEPVSHTGVIETQNGTDFSADELGGYSRDCVTSLLSRWPSTAFPA